MCLDIAIVFHKTLFPHQTWEGVTMTVKIAFLIIWQIYTHMETKQYFTSKPGSRWNLQRKKSKKYRRILFVNPRHMIQITCSPKVSETLPFNLSFLENRNCQVWCVSGCKAVDGLMESKWAKPPKEGEAPMFLSRLDVVEFLDRLGIHLHSNVCWIHSFL